MSPQVFVTLCNQSTTTRVRFLAGAGKFSLHNRIQTGSSVHLTSYPKSTMNFSLRIKRPGLEANHSPPLIFEFKNAWSYTSTSSHVFMTWCLFKHRNFTLHLPYCPQVAYAPVVGCPQLLI